MKLRVHIRHGTGRRRDLCGRRAISVRLDEQRGETYPDLGSSISSSSSL